MSCTTDGRMVVAMKTLIACTATPPARARERKPLRPHSRSSQEAGEWSGVMEQTMRAEARIVSAAKSPSVQQIAQNVLHDAAMPEIRRLAGRVDPQQGVE